MPLECSTSRNGILSEFLPSDMNVVFIKIQTLLSVWRYQKKVSSPSNHINVFISGIIEKTNMNPHQAVMVFGPLSLHHPSRCNLEEGQTERWTAQKDKFTDRRLNVTFVAEQQLTTHGRTLDGLRQTSHTQCIQKCTTSSAHSAWMAFFHTKEAQTRVNKPVCTAALCVTAVAVFLSVNGRTVPQCPLTTFPAVRLHLGNQAPGPSGSSCVKSVPATASGVYIWWWEIFQVLWNLIGGLVSGPFFFFFWTAGARVWSLRPQWLRDEEDVLPFFWF